MGLRLITPPVEEPISLEQAKAHCRVDGEQDDVLIAGLIVAARQRAEHETGRALVTQGWRMSLEAFPLAAIEAPHPPLQAVSEIRYIDLDGQSKTMDNGSYRVYTSAVYGLVLPAYGTRWPECRRDFDAVIIDLVVGYGAAADVPQAIKQWMLLCIGTWYSQREQTITGAAVAELQRGAWDALLDPFRIWRAA